jgi:hypothetical protein
MYAQLFLKSPLLILPLVALALFVGVFTAVCLRLWWLGAPAFDEVSRLPLDEGRDDRAEASHA